MMKVFSLIVFFFASVCVPGVVEGAKPSALFVFGDSYADTGNHDKVNPKVDQPWRVPYGRTWPGNPTGRFSDGLVLTDFIARFVDIPSPVTYRDRENFPDRISSGVNFAFGGSGVFETYGPEYPSISTQIDQFEQLRNSSGAVIVSSLALYVYGGNDYSVFIQKNGARGLPFLITRVVSKITADLQRLHNLGLRRFAVTTLEPAGCLPVITNPEPSSLKNCSRTDNVLSSIHNRLLAQGLSTLRRFTGAEFITLDQYSSFLSVLANGSTHGFSTDLLDSCCQGIQKGAGCGSVDEQGKPLYTVCSAPEKSFFWDGAHPTQAGWDAISQKYANLFD